MLDSAGMSRICDPPRPETFGMKQAVAPAALK
jgi:hypothetical protein